MVVGGRAASLLPLNLPHLQNLIKRDPASYRTEFCLQQTHFYSTLELAQAAGWDASALGRVEDGTPGEDTLEGLVTFMSHVVPHYSVSDSRAADSEAGRFVHTVMELLERDGASLPASLRRCLVQALVLMRSKRGASLVPTERLLLLLFRLFRVKDKSLRSLLYESIVADIRRANHPHRNNALNRTLQNFMYSVFASNAASQAALDGVRDAGDEMVAVKSMHVIIELYRRGIWNDAKTVNIVAEAALKTNCPKAMSMALNFFLGRFPGAAEVGAEDEDASEQHGSKLKTGIATSKDYRTLLHACQVGGVSKAKKNRLKRVLAKDRKQARGPEAAVSTAFSPLALVHDPQDFAERLYRILKGTHASFETKLLMMNVLSRFIGWHRLQVLDYYVFLLRYLQPHQKQVTQILAYTAQAVHPLVPPDTLHPVLRAIADNFVTDGAADPVIAAGLNGIREICTRSPLAMTETLLQDLTDYRRGGEYKNKGVMMAARSLIALFRELNPELLHRRDRGRDLSMDMAAGRTKPAVAYGEEAVEIPEEEEDGEDDEDDEDGEDESEDSEHSEHNEHNEEDGEDDEDDWVSEEGSDNDSADSVSPSVSPSAGGHLGKKGRRLPTERLLLPEDFEAPGSQTPKGDGEQDTDSEEESSSEDEPSAVIDLATIEGYKPRARADYEARLASIHAGREGREKFGTRKRGKDRASTNRVKSKSKNFLMMAHKSSIYGKRKKTLQKPKAVKRHRGKKARR